MVVGSEYLDTIHELPSRAQKIFKEIVPVLDGRDGRSHWRFPENPTFQAGLDLPKPDTILHQARITLRTKLLNSLEICMMMKETTRCRN